MLHTADPARQRSLFGRVWGRRVCRPLMSALASPVGLLPAFRPWPDLSALAHKRSALRRPCSINALNFKSFNVQTAAKRLYVRELLYCKAGLALAAAVLAAPVFDGRPGTAQIHQK